MHNAQSFLVPLLVLGWLGCWYGAGTVHYLRRHGDDAEKKQLFFFEKCGCLIDKSKN